MAMSSLGIGKMEGRLIVGRISFTIAFSLNVMQGRPPLALLYENFEERTHNSQIQRSTSSLTEGLNENHKELTRNNEEGEKNDS